jgi:SAM-dependent methyltransferase/acyl carrier protein
VSHGFHSPQMAEMEEAFERVAAGVSFRAPQVELISSWTGQPARSGELSQPAYWRKQASQPVRFAAAMEALRGYRVFIEVGPGTTLTKLGRQNLNEADRLWVNSITPNKSEWEQMLESLGHLYVTGADVNWEGFDAPYGRQKVDLPTYPFQRQRYWIETKERVAETGVTKTTWETVCEAAAHQSACARFDLDVSAYPGRWDALDRLSDAFVREALVGLGAFQAPGESHTPHSFVEAYGLEPSYERLIGRWLSRLSQYGLLRREGDRFTAMQPLAGPDLARVRAETDAVLGSDRVFLDYVLRCGENLTKILTGRMSPLATIFPSGDFTLAEDLYERAPVAAYFRDLCRSALEGFVRGRRSGTYRVLEIGAGTGSTASALLPLLPPQASEYHFTDVSDAFLNRARQKFAAYPFVRFGLLNLELDTAAQGYPEGQFDVVAATNVLHATRDLRATIRRVKSLLAPGGILILCEATTHFGWFDVSTGLIEGWQLFEDGLRNDHPLLPPETWKAALLEGGFETVSVYPPAGSPAEALAQRVMVAKAPGEGSARRAIIGSQDENVEGHATETTTVLAALLEAPPLQRHDSLVTLMCQHLAEMLRFPSPESVERKRRLTDLGLDSLMALEFSSRLTRALNLEKPLSSTIVFDYPTLGALAEHLEKDILHFAAVPDAPKAPDVAVEAAEVRMDEVEQLTDEEVEALLLKKLKRL